MDKVINGVDVSGCEFIVNRFTENHDYCCKRYGTLLKCVNDKNCYYKQLKRKEQENEQLKKLKFKSDGIELLQDANLNLHNANVKYRQALQEIREIVEGCQYGDCHECKYKPADDCRTQLIVNVIDKINSVIGAEE